jgi:hypothetical protein
MADRISESLPRLADALLEVGTRLGELGAELRALTPAPSGEAGTGEREPSQAPAAPEPAASPAQPPQAPPPAAQTSRPASQPTPPPWAAQQAASAAGRPAWAGPPRPYLAPGWTPPQPPPGQQPRWVPPPTPPPVPSLWERLSRDGAGSRILAWAGGVVTLAGVVLLLVLAIQRGYLGPLPRVLLGAGLGVVLAGIGSWLHRNPSARTGAYALTATGIAVLYLAVVAATALYHFLPPWGGLLAGLAVTAGGVALAGVWGAQLLAVFVVVCCAASAPIITGGFDALLLGFLLVLLLGTTPVQLARRWTWLHVAAALPPVIACLVGIRLAAGHHSDVNATTTAILALVTSGVVIVMSTAAALRRPGDEYLLVLLFLAAIPGLVAALLLPRVGATILPAAVGTVLVAVWVFGYVTPLSRTFALSAGGLASLAFVQATATGFDGDARAIAFLAEALVVTVLAVRLRLGPALLPAGLFALVGTVLGLVFAMRPELLVRPPRGPVDVGGAVSLGLTGLVLAVVAITVCWAVFRLGVLPGTGHAPHGWVPAGVFALYGSTAALLSVGLLVAPDRDGFLLGHVFVTVSWTVAALVLLLRGIDSVALRVAGLSLVVAALAKLVLFDLSSLDGMARVAAFLVAGLVLLAAGTRYARLVAGRARP